MNEIKRYTDCAHCFRPLNKVEAAKMVSVFIAREIAEYGGFPRKGDRVNVPEARRAKRAVATVVEVGAGGGSVAVRWDGERAKIEHPEGTHYSTSVFRLRLPTD